MKHLCLRKVAGNDTERALTLICVLFSPDILVRLLSYFDLVKGIHYSLWLGATHLFQDLDSTQLANISCL